MKCCNVECNGPIPPHLRACPACGRDNGAPNVRAAAAPAERDALRKRVRDAEQAATARGASGALEAFAVAVRGSRAVHCCRFGELARVASSDREPFRTFHALVRSQSVLPDDGFYDQCRPAVDGALFPNYMESVYFAALSLGGRGLTGYGEFSVTFKESAIADRASVFEENAVSYFRKNPIVLGKMPVGLRAPWTERQHLAVAKLGSRVTAATLPTQFPVILLRASTTREDDDFIEVHVYGSLTRYSIEGVLGPSEPKRRKPDRTMYSALRANLAVVGVTI